MPITSRTLIKASLLHLGIGAVIGALLLINRWVPLGPRVLLLKVSHVQMLVAGWLTQLIMGVAWWLFPPLARRPSPTEEPRRGQVQRGSEFLFWTTFVCLNLGILLRSVFGPLFALTQIEFFDALAGVSGILLLAAAVTFVANMWGRVRELGRGK